MTEDECEQLRRASEELCYLGQLKPAHEQAVAALKAASDTYGKNSLRLVPFYLAVADVALRDKQLKQAEEVLSLVNWLLVKDRGGPGPGNGLPTPPPELLAEETKNLFVIRMNKLYCLLHLEFGVFNEALQRAAHGAYHCSLLFGPEHLYTSELYFCLGLIFHRMSRQRDGSQQHQQQQTPGDSALAMLDKVVDIWYRFLTNPPEETAAWMLEHQRLRLREAASMLQQIAGIRQQVLGPNHVASGEALYTQGLLFLFLGDHARAKTTVRQALDIYSATLVRSSLCDDVDELMMLTVTRTRTPGH